LERERCGAVENRSVDSRYDWRIMYLKFITS